MNALATPWSGGSGSTVASIASATRPGTAGSRADQRRDEIVTTRIAPVGGHPRDTGLADHLLDGDAVQPDGCRFLQRGIQQSLTGPVGGFVDAAAAKRTGRAADDDDEPGVDHRAGAACVGAPIALARASCTYRGVPKAHRCSRASSCSAGSKTLRVTAAERSWPVSSRAHLGARLMPAATANRPIGAGSSRGSSDSDGALHEEGEEPPGLRCHAQLGRIRATKSSSSTTLAGMPSPPPILPITACSAR